MLLTYFAGRPPLLIHCCLSYGAMHLELYIWSYCAVSLSNESLFKMHRMINIQYLTYFTNYITINIAGCSADQIED